MLNKLFGGSARERVPENIRGSVEKELSIFCYCYSLCIAYFVKASKESRLDAEKSIIEAESATKLAKASIDSVENLWPAGKSATVNLRNMADIFPSWLEVVS